MRLLLVLCLSVPALSLAAGRQSSRGRGSEAWFAPPSPSHANVPLDREKELTTEYFKYFQSEKEKQPAAVKAPPLQVRPAPRRFVLDDVAIAALTFAIALLVLCAVLALWWNSSAAKSRLIRVRHVVTQ